MPVYHFTLHAYRSWNPSHPRGYTERGRGYQPPSTDKADEYDINANREKVVFNSFLQEVLILGSEDICRQRGWRLHGVGTDPSHVHLLVSWNYFIAWRAVMEKLKNILSLLLGRASEQQGRKWFVVGGSRKRVTDREHLVRLLDEYFVDHRGLYWREGMPLPEDRTGLFSGEA